MTAAPVSLATAVNARLADGDDERVADDRRAVLREHVDRALGEIAGQATATVEQLAAALKISRSSAFEMVRRGDCPSLRVGRRIVIPVPALAALLLGVDVANDVANDEAPVPSRPALRNFDNEVQSRVRVSD